MFVTVGSADKATACERLGAERAINYREEDFVAVIKDTVGGIDVILDMVGGDYFPRNLELLAEDGRLVQIALVRGAKSEVDLERIMRRRLTVTGSTLPAPVGRAKRRDRGGLARKGVAAACRGRSAADRPCAVCPG